MPPPPPPPPPTTTPQTLSSLVAAFTSFLTVCIHTILHQRALYPPSSFLTARAYNYSVRQSRHPAVCAWVADAVAATEAELLRNAVARVALVVYSATGSSGGGGGGGVRPLERYVWDVSRFPVVARPQDRDTVIARAPASATSAAAAGGGGGGGGGGGAPGVEQPEDVDMEEQFRAALAKLTVCGDVLGPLPPRCTFTLAVELKDEAGVDPPVGHPQPWIPVQPGLQAVRKSRRRLRQGGDECRDDDELGRDLGGAGTTPVRSVRAGEMVFEMWIEEGKAKAEVMAEEGLESNASSVDYR
ncbi:dna-binding protein [Diplodia corticola]|uniref:Dna-binding protein n=1 Tax=Diplodia corticola TaxID=236234 RepID=A0A1J9RDL5_9PEZI|nr:dna-binding protein [Diplodia corticola]OJD38632.1 dna-binding protein [Diplodia corticola]